jgi:hypothetical protein
MLASLIRQHITLCERQDKQTLYVCRPVLNSTALHRWAASQGFASALADLHVTVAYSHTPVAWQQFVPQHNRLTLRGGTRSLKCLGDEGAIVLAFSSQLLRQRWSEFCDGGASWDYESYQPHVTISYKSDVDLGSIEPYQDALVFGPEKFGKLDDDWHSQAANETPLVLDDEPR